MRDYIRSGDWKGTLGIWAMVIALFAFGALFSWALEARNKNRAGIVIQAPPRTEANGWIVTTGGERTIVFVPKQGTKGSPERVSARQSTITALAASPNGRWLLSGDEDGGLLLWDLKTRKANPKLWTPGTPGPIVSIGFSDDSKWTYVAQKGPNRDPFILVRIPFGQGLSLTSTRPEEVGEYAGAMEMLRQETELQQKEELPQNGEQAEIGPSPEAIARYHVRAADHWHEQTWLEQAEKGAQPSGPSH